MTATDSADALVSQLQAEVKRLKRENEKLRASNRRWMRLAGTDDLTGLPNRVFFTTALLPQVISKSNADQVSFSCLILAPDQLGEINQKYGREGGDEIVTHFADFVKGNLEEGERLVHFDGANLVVLIPDGDQSVAHRRGLALRARTVSRPFQCRHEPVSLTLSMGSVSRAPSPPGTSVDTKGVIERLLRKLSAALDQAKKQGRDRLYEDPETEF